LPVEARSLPAGRIKLRYECDASEAENALLFCSAKSRSGHDGAKLKRQALLSVCASGDGGLGAERALPSKALIELTRQLDEPVSILAWIGSDARNVSLHGILRILARNDVQPKCTTDQRPNDECCVNNERPFGHGEIIVVVSNVCNGSKAALTDLPIADQAFRQSIERELTCPKRCGGRDPSVTSPNL